MVHAQAEEYLSGDKASNTHDESVIFFIGDSINEYNTTLKLELDNQVIKYGGKVNVQGILKRTLTRFPKTGIELEGKKITLKSFDPKGELVKQTTTITDKQGIFQFSNLSHFNQKGVYTFIVSFEDGETVYESKTYEVLVNELAGYAILIQGRKLQSGIPQDEETYNKTLNRIYHQRLLKRGFTEDNIIYFNYNPKQLGVDEVPSQEKIKSHIEKWACNRISRVPAPLYLVILDHGIENQIFLGKEKISQADLDQWLTQLETCLEQRNPDTLKEYQRVVIIGSCFSGSFIPTLSKKDKNRVIITSAQADEYAYKGRKELDGIRSGSFFLEALFHELYQGHSLRMAFKNASSTTIKYTKNRVDKQHPLLDDNGDGQGSNQLSYGGDGEKIARLYLGVDDDNSALPAPINQIKMTPTLNLNNSQTAANLFVEVPDASEVSAVMVDIITPSLRQEKINIKNGTGETGQKEIPSNSVFLRKVTGERQKNTGRFEINYEGFTECGQYHLAHTVFYENGDISPYRGSTTRVYKCGGTLPDFDLKSPKNGTTTFTMTTFAWEAPDNPTDIPITYTLLIAKDEQFEEIIYQQEEIQSTIAKVTGLEDLEDYHWKIKAVNENGDNRTSPTVFFYTDDPSALHKCLEVQVIDAIEKTPIHHPVDFQFTPMRTHTHYDQADPTQGHYIRCADPAPTPYHIIMSALGYQSIQFEWSSYSNEFNSGVEFSNNYDENEKIIFELQPLPLPPPQPLPSILISGFGVDDVVNKVVVQPRKPVQSENVAYEITVTNLGRMKATGVVLTTELPEKTQFISSNSQCTADANTVTCSLAELKASEETTVKIVVSNIQADKWVNQARVKANKYPANITSTSATPYLSVSLSDRPDPVKVGGTLYYTAKVELSDYAPTVATGIQLTMQLPMGIELKSVKTDNYVCDVSQLPSITCDLTYLSVGDAETVEIEAVLKDLDLLLLTHEAQVVANEYPTHTDRERTEVALYPDVKVDLVFFIDVTGSMQEEINGVIEALREFIAEVDPNTTQNIALVTFRDEVKVEAFIKEAFTKTGHLEKLLSAISKLKASGGNSCPEASAEALSLAVSHLKEGGTLFLATDTSPYPDADLGEITQGLEDKNIILNIMVTGDCSNN